MRVKIRNFTTIEALNQKEYYGRELIPLEETISTEQNVFFDNGISSEPSNGERLLLRFALAKLTKRQRQVINGVFFDGKTCKQISLELGLHYTTARQYYKKALKKIRKICLGSEQSEGRNAGIT